MIDTISVVVRKSDWNSSVRAWRCTVVALAGASVEAIYSDGNRIDTGWIQVLPSQGMIRWVRDDSPPDEMTVTIVLAKKLKEDRGALLPVVSAVLVALISAGPAYMAGIKSRPDTQWETWTVEGALDMTALRKHNLAPTLIKVLVNPPDTTIRDDGSYAATVNVALRGGNNRKFPTLTFIPPENLGLKNTVMHIPGPSGTLPFGAEQILLEYSPNAPNVVARTPIPFYKKSSDPYEPKETATPIEVGAPVAPAVRPAK